MRLRWRAGSIKTWATCDVCSPRGAHEADQDHSHGVLGVACISAVILGLFAVMSHGGTDPIASCMAKVKRGNPAIMSIAAETMPKSAVLVPLDGADNCEETYIARPAVTAKMMEWRTKQEAVSYLKARHWHSNPSWYLTSVDHEDVSAVINEAREHGTRYVEVSFVAFGGPIES
jgi:hypothetical protein